MRLLPSFLRRAMHCKLRYDHGATCHAFMRNVQTGKDQDHAHFVTMMEVPNLNFKFWMEVMQRQNAVLLDSMQVWLWKDWL